MARWYSVPIWDYETPPTTSEQLEMSGLYVGGNMSGRSTWIAGSHNIPFCKCAYFVAGNDLYEIVAVVSSDWDYSNMHLYEGKYVDGAYYPLNTYNFNRDASMAQLGLARAVGTIGQTTGDNRNPEIPVYSSRSEALQAMDDGIWQDIEDPYEWGGSSDTGGGTGDFDDQSDPIPIPALPSLSAVDTGFITLFNPSVAQLRGLAAYMWNSGASGLDLNALKKLFADPMDAILGLSIIPVNVPDGGLAEVKVGNIGTGINMTKAASQYVEVNCGSVSVSEYWGAYLDYSPFTKCEIFLPFIGFHPLDIDDVMKKTLSVVYHVDILTGACIAYIYDGHAVLYTFIGACSVSIPITGSDWTNMINGIINIAGSIGTMVATGGSTAPAAATSIMSTAVNTLKPTVEKSGSVSGGGGILGVQYPYIVLSRPRQAIPSGQSDFMGYPSFITETLSSLSGYTEIEKINLSGVPADGDELAEIETLLKGGVII